MHDVGTQVYKTYYVKDEAWKEKVIIFYFIDIGQ